MLKNKRHGMVSWIMSMILVLNVFFVPTSTFAAELSDVVIESQTHTIKQGGNPVGSNLDFGKSLEIESEVKIKLIDTNNGNLIVNANDTLTLPIHENLKIDPIPPEQDIMAGSVKIGTLRYENNPAKAMITFTLDQSSVPQDERITSTTIRMNQSFKFEGIDEGTLPKDFTLFGTKYTIDPPKPEINYTLNKSGVVDMKEQTILWTVDITAKDGKDAAVSLGKMIFEDELNVAEVGEYVSGSFTINGSAKDPTYKNYVLSFVFPDAYMPENLTKIQFKTSIPDDVFFGQVELPKENNTPNEYDDKTVNNTAKLLDEKKVPVATDTAEVKFTPNWISKHGVANMNTITNEKKTNHISWQITVNSHGKTLSNVKVKDLLHPDLEFVQARLQEHNGTGWVNPKDINSAPADGVYNIGNIDKPILLTIVSKVKGSVEGDIPKVRMFDNQATMTFDEYENGKIGSTKKVATGKNLLFKNSTGLNWEADGLYAEWKVELNLKNAGISPGTDFKIYDVFYYNHEIKDEKKVLLDLSTVDNKDELKSNGITDAMIKALSGDNRQATGQRLKEDSIQIDDTRVKHKVYPLKKEGKRVGEILEFSNFTDLDKNYKITFKSQVVAPKLVFPNIHLKDSIVNQVFNSAGLVKDDKIVNHTQDHVQNRVGSLYKEAIDATKVSDTPGEYVNEYFKKDEKINGEIGGYNHKDNTVVFRFSVNSHQVNVTKTKVVALNGEIKEVGEVSLVDELPKGWEIIDIVDGQKFVVFEGERDPNFMRSNVAEANKTPLDPDAIGLSMKIVEDTSDLSDPNGLTTQEFSKLIFTFTKELDKSYVILVKAKPGDAIRKAYNNKTENIPDNDYENNGKVVYQDQRAKATNKMTIKSDTWSGQVQYQRIRVPNEPLTKNAERISNGIIGWTIDYKPTGTDYSGGSELKLTDKLPNGVILPMDENGKPKVAVGYIEIQELDVTADGKYTLGGDVANAQDFVSYNEESSELTFKIPDNKKNYRFRYITHVIQEGLITNNVTLLSGAESLINDPVNATFSVQKYDVEATLNRLGKLEILKVASSDDSPLAGAKFELRTKTGKFIKGGETSATGELSFFYLGEGAYDLVETQAPSGYKLLTSPIKIVVKKEGDKMVVQNNGATLMDALKVKNDKEENNSGGNSGGGNPPSGGNSGNNPPSSTEKPDTKIDDNVTPKTDLNKDPNKKDLGGDSISDSPVPKAEKYKNTKIAGAPKTGIGSFENERRANAVLTSLLLAYVLIQANFFRKNKA